MKTEAEVGVMQPQTKARLGHQRWKQGKVLLYSLGGSLALRRNWERGNVCCFNSLVCGHLLHSLGTLTRGSSQH